MSGDILPPLKSKILKWGLLVQVIYRLQYQRAIPACPAVIGPVTDILLLSCR